MLAKRAGGGPAGWEEKAGGRGNARLIAGGIAIPRQQRYATRPFVISLAVSAAL